MENEEIIETKIEDEEMIENKEKKFNKKVLIIVIAVIIILIFAMVAKNKNGELNETIPDASLSVAIDEQTDYSYQTKTDSQANVTVEITPQKVGVQMQENIFEISFNTHSVDLNYDFQDIIILKDDLGNVYRASSWSGGEGGHHLSGEIVFSDIHKDAKSIQLEIDGVGEVKRVFKWDI